MHAALEMRMIERTDAGGGFGWIEHHILIYYPM
jgi:hypothetical protein